MAAVAVAPLLSEVVFQEVVLIKVGPAAVRGALLIAATIKEMAPPAVATRVKLAAVAPGA